MDLMKTFNKTLITTQAHEFGLPLKLFGENKKLNQFYKVITTNVDRNCVEFVSAQHNTTQHNATQHNTTQHNATQRNATQIYSDPRHRAFQSRSLINVTLSLIKLWNTTLPNYVALYLNGRCAVLVRSTFGYVKIVSVASANGYVRRNVSSQIFTSLYKFKYNGVQPLII